MISDKINEINWQPSQQDLFDFAKTLLLGGPIVAVFWVLLIKIFSSEWNLIAPTYILSAFVLAGTLIRLAPTLSKPLYLLWFSLVCVIDIVISFTVLTIVYFCVLLPIGIAYQASGKAAQLKKGICTKSLSYWTKAHETKDLNKYYKQY